MVILYISIFGCYNHKKTKSWNRTNVQCSNCNSIFDGFIWLISCFQCILYSKYFGTVQQHIESLFLGIFQNWNRSSFRFWVLLRDIIFSHWFTGAFSSAQLKADCKFDKNLKINNKAAAITSNCCTGKTSELILKYAVYCRDTIFLLQNTISQYFLNSLKNF